MTSPDGINGRSITLVSISQTALGERSLGKKSDHAYRQFKPKCRIAADILNVTDKILYDNCYTQQEFAGIINYVMEAKKW